MTDRRRAGTWVDPRTLNNAKRRITVNYCEFLKNELGPNYVIHRRTPRITAKYGDDVKCITPKEHARATRDYRFAHGREYDEPRAAMYVALLAAEATLSLCSGKLPPHAESRRKETIALIRATITQEQNTF